MSTIEKQAAAGQLAGSGAVGSHEQCHSATPGWHSGRPGHDSNESALVMQVSTTAANNSVRPRYIIAFRANTTV